MVSRCGLICISLITNEAFGENDETLKRSQPGEDLGEKNGGGAVVASRCQGPVIGKGWGCGGTQRSVEGDHCAWGVGRVAQDKVSIGQIGWAEGCGEDFGFYSG